MKKSSILSIILLFGLYLPNQAWSYPYSEIYVFGDSLSDTGRFFEATGQPTEPFYDGHFSDGPMWVEYLAYELDLGYNPETNFSWGGATTGTTNTLGDKLPGLQQQVNTYIEGTSAADSTALYVVWAGSNDFLAGVTNPTKTINTSVTNIVTAVTNLRDHGAKHILVPNLPDLGTTPRAKASGISTTMTQLTVAFNKALAKSLLPLEVIQVDMPATFEIVSDPDTIAKSSFSLTNVTEVCLNQEAGTICEDASTYFYWDDIHPSTVGHELIALFFFGAVADTSYLFSTEPDPYNPPLLSIPVVEIVTDTGTKVFFKAVMMQPDSSVYILDLAGNSLQTTKSFKDIVTLPNDRQYPTFDLSSGILSMPIVHLIASEATAEGLLLNFSGKFSVELTHQMSTNPFSMPSFLLTGAVPLE
ncbi:SGNH/GDSL hydrolase family protein [Candidatus Parabeggiatoa sp. HSG14]|uniref:SGNH/GDSL hydrolase family protein n=1 Tax=Candidatus Parabeggiatoa sp. HSG14 TaxID=3055593 RepID=UPI0025A8C50E|nr:SGNH/GDSL hydrolase family protein [Thiotrichales bacterium HSG14]